MKIKKSVFTKIIPQYVLIYCIAATSGSLLFVRNIKLFEYFIIGVFVLLTIYKKSNRLQYVWHILIILFVAVMFVHLLSGGIGIDSWLLYSCQILSVYCAFFVDKENFLNRYVKMVSVLAAISIVAWLMRFFVPNILDLLLRSRIELYNKSHTYTTTYKGLLFFTYSLDTRNCGIYSEPGRYQAILQGALFIVLFCQKFVRFEKRKSIFATAVLILTILTSQSTTGYIMLLAMVVLFLFTRRENINAQMKKAIIVLVFLGATYLLYNLSKYGVNSILGRIVFGKFQDTDISDMSSSGGARLRMIELCLNQIMLKPWGVGLIQTQGNIVAAGVLRFLAAVGVIPGFLTMLWIFLPVKRTFSGYVELIAFLFIYLYLGLAQSYVFYSGLLVIPIVLHEINKCSVEEI